MSARFMRRFKKGKRVIEKVIHPPYLNTYIKSGEASAAPPLGPQLATRGINVAQFCKYFNERTKDIKPGIPLPSKIRVNPDRTFDVTIFNPPMSYFIKQAAGTDRGSSRTKPDEIAGIITLKHVYEIAKVKAQDPIWETESLHKVCRNVIANCHTVGVKVVKDISEEDLAEFLKKRKEEVAALDKEREEKRAAKLLRVS